MIAVSTRFSPCHATGFLIAGSGASLSLGKAGGDAVEPAGRTDSSSTALGGRVESQAVGVTRP